MPMRFLGKNPFLNRLHSPITSNNNFNEMHKGPVSKTEPNKQQKGTNHGNKSRNELQTNYAAEMSSSGDKLQGNNRVAATMRNDDRRAEELNGKRQKEMASPAGVAVAHNGSADDLAGFRSSLGITELNL